MHAIERFDDLASLERDWNDVYDADPESQFFLSWTWMSTWLRTFRRDWVVLAAKRHVDASTFDAFFPLAISTEHSPGPGFRTVIDMAGNRHADYTGFICRPDLAKEAGRAFSRHILTMNWAALRLEQIRASDDRLRSFLRQFPAEAFPTRDEEAAQVAGRQPRLPLRPAAAQLGRLLREPRQQHAAENAPVLTGD